MTTFTPGQTLTADIMNALVASFTPGANELLGGNGTSTVSVTVTSPVTLVGGVLTVSTVDLQALIAAYLETLPTSAPVGSTPWLNGGVVQVGP